MARRWSSARTAMPKSGTSSTFSRPSGSKTEAAGENRAKTSQMCNHMASVLRLPRHYDQKAAFCSGLEQVTHFGGFTSFPEFSPDGKTLVFCSDRDAKERYEFNIFTAKWEQN